MQNNRMSLNNEKRNKWSIRRLSGVGVASVIVASSMIGGAAQVNAAELKTNKLTEVKESRDILQPKNIDEINKKLEMTGKSIKKSDMMTENSKVEKKVADNKAEPKSQDKNMKHKHEMTKPEDVKKSVSENIKDKIDVPASYLENAKYPGPFTAGVNQVIPYEAFGGDGMLTRLLLKSSDKAPWSDNGTAKHPGLLPLDKLTNGHYFYNVELDGKAKGKSDKALLEQLKANGTQSYSATVKVYGSKNGKPDLSNVIATKKVTINLKGMMKHEMTKPEDVKKSVSENIKDKIDVPASYLENAKYPGPFTAGVNQVIPYEAFGGDGMLTRLLLKSSDKALWSDNGTAKHPGLLPLDKLTNGHYFYNVELDGKAKGKSDKALLEQLKANGTQSYSATVKVYGSKNGKPDLSNVIATKKVTINLKGKHNHKDHNHNGHNPTDPMNKGHMGMGGHHGHHMHSSNTNQNGSQLTNSTTNQGTLSNGKTRLPNTGQSETNLTLAGIIGLIFASILGFFAIKRKNR
ncbi:SSURE domain-containing protein [Gemella massiliensis]|uniref:SSURE domain-containing protein n=1 Tax=Gemella massiliensis TaxID=1909670 RepID=UPI000B132F28|nr:fibronectin-binding SSURE repeat-containing protein [Gemella massiliensis]